ncbi:MAG: glycosyltransferase [Oscillospiraceae bacterium]|nr:glycosyltransferase [Oscillospiraceae bacterium]
MDSDYSLSVVIPAVDETYSLENTFNKLDKNKAASEYIFILSKSCTEGCLKTVQKLCERDDCRWIYQSGKGFGNAIRDSFFEVKGSHIVLWSADEATDASSFPEMLKLSKENPEKIIKISRFLRKDGFEGYGRIKKAVNFISQRAFALLYRSDLTEFTNPTQIAPVRVYRMIKWERNDFAFLPEMTFKPIKLGIDFIEVPTKNVVRTEGKSHNNFIGWLKYYYMILKIFLTDKKDLISEVQE